MTFLAIEDSDVNFYATFANVMVKWKYQLKNSAQYRQNLNPIKITSFYGIRRFRCKLQCKIVNGTFKQNISIASVIDKTT